MPSKQIGAWSSGTGLSGVAASLIYLGLTTAGLTNSQIFLISLPLIVVYCLLYFFGLKMPFYVPVDSAGVAELDEGDEGDDGPVGEIVTGYVCKAMVNWIGTPWTNIVPPEPEQMPECLKELNRVRRQAAMGDGYVEASESEPAETDAQIGGWAKWKRDVWPVLKEMHKFTLWNNINLALVYVAEYAVQFMAPFSFPCGEVEESQNFWLKNSFVITQLCYQFGVLISRSSLLCLRIRHVWIMTIVQTLNAIAWFVQAKVKYMSDPDDEDRELKFAFGLFAWMIFVGLMGGASYVNVFYNILEETRVMQEDEEREIVEFVASRRRSDGDVEKEDVEREAQTTDDTVNGESDEARAACRYIAGVWREKRNLAMNIGALYATIGITTGSLLDLFFTLVVLKEDGCS
ncbi:putative calcium channel protein [Trypanosoma grayi]|uniref:putative calcium channel protein n=1 Tax=Trypanosoma grayi TaxID=71804 RepID=UPI0004F422B2|nr:putative calcium channel protein [Trypanosoma grayi]KEG05530.1 putative calcium channel protein [Trypanosoma grayi]